MQLGVSGMDVANRASGTGIGQDMWKNKHGAAIRVQKLVTISTSCVTRV